MVGNALNPRKGRGRWIKASTQGSEFQNIQSYVIERAMSQKKKKIERGGMFETGLV